MPQEQGLIVNGKGDFKSVNEIIYEGMDKSEPLYKEDPYKEVSFDTMIDEMIRRREARREIEGIPDSIEIEIKSDTPIVIGLFGDQHLSGKEVDYEMLRRDVHFIAENPKCYTILGGDVVDGAAFNPAQDDKIASFTEETTMAIKMFDMLGKGSILAALQGDHCLDVETEACTRNGWKKYDQLTTDDEFLTITPDGICEWHKPDRIIINDFDGKLNSIKSTHVDLLVTDKHNLAIKRRKINGIFTVRTDTFLKENSLDNNQFVMAGINNNEEYPLEDGWIKLIAWIMTDGWISDKHCGIVQREEKAHLPREVLNECGIEYSERTRLRRRDNILGKVIRSTKPAVYFYIHAKDRKKINELLDNGKYSLPSWVYKLSSRQFEVFFNSLIDGDGTRRKGITQAFYQKRPLLVGELQIVCAMNGYRTSIYEYLNEQLRLNICKRSFVRAVNAEIGKVDYKGKVWDITVPNHIFLVRRGGKAYFTGNCMWSEKSGPTLYQNFREKYHTPLMRGSSVIMLKVGDVVYRIVCAHQLPGNSIYNDSHPENRESKFGRQGADIYAGFHNHKKALSQQSVSIAGEGSKMQTFIAGGPYKLTDSYSAKKGFGKKEQSNESTVGAVWLVLHPYRKEVEAFWSLESAKERIEPYLTGKLRETKPEEPSQIIREIAK